jgi:8-oxo-dGTP diphosphatase
MPDQHIHSVSVAGIVVNEAGDVLVVQREDNSHWEPPGGILERDETFEAGVAREVHEETGIRVDVEQLSGVYKNMKLGVVALVYRCRPLAGQARPTHEAHEARWVRPDEIPHLMTPAYSVRVMDALREGVASRSHDGHSLTAGD